MPALWKSSIIIIVLTTFVAWQVGIISWLLGGSLGFQTGPYLLFVSAAKGCYSRLTQKKEIIREGDDAGDVVIVRRFNMPIHILLCIFVLPLYYVATLIFVAGETAWDPIASTWRATSFQKFKAVFKGKGREVDPEPVIPGGYVHDDSTHDLPPPTSTSSGNRNHGRTFSGDSERAAANVGTKATAER